VHLANPSIDLETHIRDVLGVLFHEDLTDVHLIGHSYGGMVATGVANHAAGRLKQIIYLDAFVPKDGQSVFDLAGPQGRAHFEELAETQGEGWRLPPTPLPPDTSPADVEWIKPRRHFQPIGTFSQALRLENGEPKLPRAYIYCKRFGQVDRFAPFAERARLEPGWRFHEIDASHSPHVTAPQVLADLLDRLAGDVG
jgi:pimeloyl-ACP methyl ester carboxylesterase